MSNQSDLLVGAANGPSVLRFDGTTGTAKGPFTHGDPSPVSGPSTLLVGPGRHLFVRMWSFAGDVREYDATGMYLRTWVSRTDGGGGGMALDPLGRLFVVDKQFGIGAFVRHYDSNGAPLGAFIAPGSGGLISPTAMCFTPEGNLLVRQTHYPADIFNVLRYDGTSGAFIDEFVGNKSGGLGGHGDMCFGPDGKLYIVDHDHAVVRRYDGASGAFEGDFTSGAGPASLWGLAFDDAGDLFVSSSGTDAVLRFHGDTGVLAGVFASPTNPVPTTVTFLSPKLKPRDVPPQPPPPPAVDTTLVDAIARFVSPILTGVVDDSGGVQVVPGRGPVPVPPWSHLWLGATQAEQDAILALVIARIANGLSEAEDREYVRQRALKLVSASVLRAMRGTRRER